MNYTEIAKRIKAIRIKEFGDEHGSPKKFAEFLGIPYTTYRNYEVKRVGLDVLVAINEKLGISFNELIYGEAEPVAAEAAAPYLHLDPLDRFWLDVFRKFEQAHPPENRENIRMDIFSSLYRAQVQVRETWKRYNPKPNGVELFEERWREALRAFFEFREKMKM